MRLSIEISTFNRSDVLRLVLQRLAKQTYPLDQFEVVIADDGSSDGTEEMVRTMKDLMPYTIRFIPHLRIGSGPNHNVGIRGARGEIVLMLADDILPEPNLVKEHMRIHEQNPMPTVVVVGKLLQSPELPQTVLQRSWDPLKGRGPEGKQALDFTDFWVSNLSFKKNFMLNYGMFREWPSAAHEDLDLGYRLQCSGMKLIFNPNAIGYHHHAETIESISARAYTHGYNWHFLEEHVPDIRIRMKCENVKLIDGQSVYLRTKLKAILRRILINRLTVCAFAVPWIRKAELHVSLAPLVPFLIAKVASYRFHKGLKDYRKESVRTQ